jgi:hypothetical protein
MRFVETDRSMLTEGRSIGDAIMNNELYFLSPIIEALQHPHPKESLLQAFQQINEKGNQDSYQDGYAQFEVFMNLSESISIEAALTEIDKKFDLSFDSDIISTLILTCDEQSIGLFTFGQQSSTTSFDPIQPGLYQLRTETGWVIWEEFLIVDDLLWSHAFPNQPLLMAADTDESQKFGSKSFQLLDDAIRINIYPGPEFGSLTIQSNTKGMVE